MDELQDLQTKFDKLLDVVSNLTNQINNQSVEVPEVQNTTVKENEKSGTQAFIDWYNANN